MPQFGYMTQKRRTNRNLTNYAINAVTEALNTRTSRTTWEQHNTNVSVESDSSICVSLNGEPILRILRQSQEPSEIRIYADGGGCDADGNPSMLSRERLNGLLDSLGWEGVIPLNVRIWYDQENGVAYLVNLENKIAFNKHYCKMISIKADSNEFKVCDREPVKL